MPALWKSASTASRPTPGQQNSNVRGRISGPIPIPDDEFPIRSPGAGIAIPASKDDEFPIRKPGSGIATTYPLLEESQQETLSPAHSQLQPPSFQAGAISAVSVSGSHTGDNSNADFTSINNEEARLQLPSEAPLGSQTPTSQRVNRTSPQRTSPRRSSPTVQRTAASSTIRYSTVSQAPSTRSTEGGPSRKKSTLRTALGRLFGRKKKSLDSQGSSNLSGRGSGTLGSAQHGSNLSALNQEKESEPKRSNSLPITEYDRALRSHSIGPEDLITINSARNSIQAATDLHLGHSRKRAVTASGRLFPPLHPSTLRNGRESEWGGGLSPRPASTHGRGSRVNPDETDDPNDIGRAITSDSGAGTRRRSRSLSELKDVLGVGLGPGSRQEERRRSDEIRYWRESYNPGLGSPLSSTRPDDVDEDRERPQTDASNANGNGSASANAQESARADKQPPTPKTPPQPFNFGSIGKDMVGMKITQAVSMDMRIGSLENRMGRLERVVEQLCHAVPGFKAPFAETPLAGPIPDPSSYYTSAAAPPMIPAIYQTMSSELGISNSSETASQHSHMSFGQAPTYIDSLHPPSSSATQTGSLTTTAPSGPGLLASDNRPTSNTTVREATSLPALTRTSESSTTSTPTPTQQSLLLTQQQLETERLARASLEAQVAKLSQRLNTLSATMYAMVRSQKSQEPLRPPTPTSEPILPHHVVPVLAYDESDLTMHADENENESGRQSVDGGGFLTPSEGAGPRSTLGYNPKPYMGYEEDEEDETDTASDIGELGTPDEVEDAKRKKAARTLSLGQLTMGRKGNQVPQVQV